MTPIASRAPAWLKNLRHPPTDPNTPVWRYFSHEKFELFLRQRAIWFTRLDQFKDEYEGFVNEDILRRISGNSKDKNARVKAANLANLLRITTFASCWSMQEAESHKLWANYASHNQGEAIKSTFGKLQSSFRKFAELRVVQYVDIKNISTYMRSRNIYDLAACKRKEFEFEQEVRLVRAGWKHSINNGTPAIDLDHDTTGFSATGPIESFVEHIYINPCANGSYVDEVTTLIKRAELSVPITKSAIHTK